MAVTGFWRVAPWISRLMLLPSVMVFTMLTLKFFVNPGFILGQIQETGGTVMLGSPQALTHLRVFSVFLMGYVVGGFICLFWKSQLRHGLAAVALMMIAAIVVRAYGVVADGTPLAGELRLFVAEAVCLVLAGTGLLIETARTRKEHANY
jgi:hypothetical protein